MAMESRGFNAGNQRSSFYEISFSWQDGVLMPVSYTHLSLTNSHYDDHPLIETTIIPIAEKL